MAIFRQIYASVFNRIRSFCIYSNSNVPPAVLQSLKKQCNPLLKKSFKERNPDVDMDEIQNNPNVPEDVKAAITGALSLTLEEDEAEDGGETCDESGVNVPADNVETFDDDYIMMSDDDGKKGRRKRLDENDEDWLTGRRKGARPRKAKRKHKKRSKTHLENGGDNNGKQTMDDKDSKVKKKRSKKSNEMNGSMNGTLESSMPNSMLSNSFNSSLNCTLDSTLSNNTNASSLNGLNHTNSNFDSTMNSLDPMRKESKQKKTPKKRDSNDKTINGLLKKTSRRQFTSISAIMACIEAVVQGNDVSISDVPIKTEKMEQNLVPFNTVSGILSSPIKSETFDDNKAETIYATIKVEPKKKPRRKSTVKNTESSQLAKLDGVPSPQSPPSSLINVRNTTGSASKTNTKKPRANGTTKSKTSMRKKNKSNSLAK